MTDVPRQRAIEEVQAILSSPGPIFFWKPVGPPEKMNQMEKTSQDKAASSSPSLGVQFPTGTGAHFLPLTQMVFIDMPSRIIYRVLLERSAKQYQQIRGDQKSASDLKILSKNSLINLLRKLQLRLHLWSITINTQTNFQIISQYRIFCEICPTLVQNAILWAYMVEQYFRTSSYKIALGRFKKKFKKMPDLKTIQRVVERFQTAYTLKDERRLGRPHTLSDNDQTELREHLEEHPGTSVRRAAQQLGHKCERVQKTLKEEGFFP